jgi:hypothetical protein
MTDAPEHHNPKDADHDLEEELGLAPADGPAPSA